MAEKKPARLSWNEYFMRIAFLVSSRSTCLRRKVGAVIVRDKHILTTGYNGPPRGFLHCEERGGCLRDKKNIVSGSHQEWDWALHAEQNAIIQAAYQGVSIKNGEIYCTTQPCSLCARMIVNAGLKKVFFCGDYPDKFSLQIFNEADIKLEKMFLEDHD